MAVRALTFDVFGTLLDWRTTVTEAFRASVVDGDPEELADAWRGLLWPTLAEVNEGKRPWGNFDDLHFAMLDQVLTERGLDAPLDERRRLVGAWHRLDPWPDVVEGLDALRRERVTAALSNGHIGLLVDLTRHAGIRFDCLLSAELAHAYKPAAAVYQTAARLLGLEPGEVMMVACHPVDLAGARAAGLQTALIDRPLEYGPGSPAREYPEATESIGGHLGELARRLQ